MASKRCSNCEKSITARPKNGSIIISKVCNATGEKISDSIKTPSTKCGYYETRRCNEFFPRKEYIDQFDSPIDRALSVIERGKKLKDVIDPL